MKKLQGLGLHVTYEEAKRNHFLEPLPRIFQFPHLTSATGHPEAPHIIRSTA